MIKVKNINFRIGTRNILNDVSFNIPVGKITALLGANGAGKSTIVKLISKEIKPQSGNIFYNELEVNQINTYQLSKIRAVMSQHSHIIFPFSVFEIVELGAISHESTVKKDEIIKDVMQLTNTWCLKDKLIHQLSGGEKQRVHFARVLLQIWESTSYPRYLILDEPTSSMDIAQQHYLLEIANNLKEKNIGILAVMHDLNLAIEYADNLVLLKEGKLIKAGEKSSVIQKKYLDETYNYPLHIINNPINNQPLIIPEKHKLISNYK